jgi:uncharacterized membrane protein YccF (DUF307 family)
MCSAVLTTDATVRLPTDVVPASPIVAPQSNAPLATASAPPEGAAVPILTQTINVTVQAAAAPVTPVVVVAATQAGPGCLIRALYFCTVGLWLGALWTGVAWLLLLSVLGLPLGLLMLNRLPQVMTLKPIRTATQVTTTQGVVFVSQGLIDQRSFLVRALYFALVGWWLSGIWLFVAWACVGVTLGLGLPLAFWMFDRTPAVVTLARQ